LPLPQKVETKSLKKWKQKASKSGNKKHKEGEKQSPLKLPDIKIVINWN
jgi:hypothetical protein